MVGRRASFQRLRGAASAEFALAAVPLLLVGLAVAETGHWLMTRQLVRLALHEAARSGASQHAHPDAIRTAFEQALTPLYVPVGVYGTAQARMRASHDRLWRATGLSPWQIEVLGPASSAYQDFGSASRQHGGRPTISNDYLAEQHARAQARWPQGVGPRSGLDIHQANVLHLQVSYLKRPLTPIVGSVLKAAASVAPVHAQPALAAGMLSIRLDSKMTMQSDPVAWDLPSAGFVSDTGIAPPATSLPPPKPALPSPPSRFLPPDDAGAISRPPPSSVQPPPDDGSDLCGVVLCCA